MSSAAPTGLGTIRTYSILCGVTPLVPVPFLDDVIRGYFRRRLVRDLASLHGRLLTTADVSALADQPSRGCLAGCLVSPFVYLLKRLFRKIFYFLEWKRATDVASETYHFGLLVDHALQQRWLGREGAFEAARVRTAVDAVLARQGTSPVEAAIREAFLRSRDGVLATAGAMRRALGGLRRQSPREQVEQAIGGMGAPQVEGVAGELESALKKVPPGYVESLGRRLGEELGVAAAAEAATP